MSINLSKITLEKQGDSHKINLVKDGNLKLEEISINLNWNQKKGFWSSLIGSSIDLDLGVWYELNDSNRNCIDGLQFAHGQGGRRDQRTRQGSYTQSPWIWHTGDDRSGSTAEGESILINPLGIEDLKRITIYCFIYDGVVKWSDTNAVVTIKTPGNPDIEVEMGKQQSTKSFCAIAEILFAPDNSMTVKKLVTFHNGHPECDRAYNWGMKWQEGGK